MYHLKALNVTISTLSVLNGYNRERGGGQSFDEIETSNTKLGIERTEKLDLYYLPFVVFVLFRSFFCLTGFSSFFLAS